MASRVSSLRTWVGVAIAMTMWAGHASAQEVLRNEQVAGALAMPLIGDGPDLMTFLTVTNVSPFDRILHFNVIDGDDWNAVDFDCEVTAGETLLLEWRFVEMGLRRLVMECNQGGLRGEASVSRVFAVASGVLFITMENEIGGKRITENQNDLLGDFVIVNAASGYAAGASAIPFQGKDPLAPGVGDRDYHFDNIEYSMFPATLASNFIAPGENKGVEGLVGASLILFTLDGRPRQGSQAALDIVFFDDDETPTSAHYTFDCFSFVELRDIDPNFDANLLGSPAGHFYMTTIDADQESGVHDNKFGNGNRIRVVGVHGWLIQSVAPFNWTNEDPSLKLWMRSLAQGMLPQAVDGSDVPTFDGL